MRRATKQQTQTPTTQSRRWRVRPLSLLLLAAMALFGYKFLQKTQEIKGLAAQEAALQAQNQNLAQQNAQIRQSQRYYQTNQYVENAARSTLGLIKPGETVIVAQPVRQRIETVRSAPPVPLAPPDPAWKQWWNAFFG